MISPSAGRRHRPQHEHDDGHQQLRTLFDGGDAELCGQSEAMEGVELDYPGHDHPEHASAYGHGDQRRGWDVVAERASVDEGDEGGRHRQSADEHQSGYQGGVLGGDQCSAHTLEHGQARGEYQQPARRVAHGRRLAAPNAPATDGQIDHLAPTVGRLRRTWPLCSTRSGSY
jgi:hypothetical protein